MASSDESHSKGTSPRQPRPQPVGDGLTISLSADVQVTIKIAGEAKLVQLQCELALLENTHAVIFGGCNSPRLVESHHFDD